MSGIHNKTSISSHHIKVRWWRVKEEDDWLDLILTVHDKDVFFTRSNCQKKSFPWREKLAFPRLNDTILWLSCVGFEPCQ